MTYFVLIGLSISFRDYWQPFFDSSRFDFIAQLFFIGVLPLLLAGTLGAFLARNKLGKYELTWLGGELVKYAVRNRNKEKKQNQ
ncbi:MAG: hypothetical protein AMJ53_06145 [Gammaproteobacteria bacterium SG8_11]|nr:MAG: hypothetical protein AMJ53_06145 [Gammaproteobacteria bacterium SG8_11]